ncbi:hypothetical protein [Nocardia sp. NPDC048505]|uniref:DUF7144 family membrane protein n=1 Tax=unclassified Nocardia TaxID=2637762 RepID=UPI0033C4DFE4
MTHSADPDSPVRQGIAAGVSVGAAILLLIAGVLSVLNGISAVANDNLFVVGPDYTYKFDITGWGWFHIIVGAIMALSAIGLMMGATWGKVAALTFVTVSIIGNFLWLPYYPLWSILIIAIEIVVIWAITTWRSDQI